jgi:chitinase
MKTKKPSPFLLLTAIVVLVIVFAASSCKDEPDVVPPSAPSELSYTATTSSISLSWLPSQDNVGIAGYKIFRDGVVAGNTKSTSFTDASLIPNATYTYEVLAYDEADNESAKSKSLKATTLDSCPTCSKWLSSITFLPPPNGGKEEVFSGEEKLAGSLFLENVSV